MDTNDMRRGLGKKRLAELRQTVSDAADYIDHCENSLRQMQYLRVTGRMQGAPMQECRRCHDKFANLTGSGVCAECSFNEGHRMAVSLIERGILKVEIEEDAYDD